MNHDPSFLKDLTVDTLFTGHLLNHPVIGQASLERLLARIGVLSLPQVPVCYEVSIRTQCMEYQARYIDGDTVHAIVSITRDETGKVLELNVGRRTI